MPSRISSMPSVTGPTNCHLTGAPSRLTFCARSTNARSAVNPAPPSGSDACSIMPSSDDNCGSEGMVAMSNSPIANAAAASVSRCGRLPTPIDAPSPKR